MLRVLQFNWPKLLGGVLVTVTAVFLATMTGGILRTVLLLVALGAAYFVVSSLAATWWVYDHGRLETLDWFTERHGPLQGEVASIHVGYDDVRSGLENAAASATLTGLYYPASTETSWHGHSLERAIQHDDRTCELQLKEAVSSDLKFDLVMFGFTAHEIRDREERRRVLGHAKGIVKPHGRIVVLEHLRDAQNLAVYGPGALHFLQGRTWLEDFASLNLEVLSSRRVNGLIREYILGVHPYQ